MPRAKGEANRSELIRELIRNNPRMRAKQIADLMAEKGHRVSTTLVYGVKAKMGRRQRRQRRERAMAAGRDMGFSNPVQFILKVKTLANEAGGIRQFKQLVDALAE
jgi:hypothetical protein